MFYLDLVMYSETQRRLLPKTSDTIGADWARDIGKVDAQPMSRSVKCAPASSWR